VLSLFNAKTPPTSRLDSSKGVKVEFAWRLCVFALKWASYFGNVRLG